MSRVVRGARYAFSGTVLVRTSGEAYAAAIEGVCPRSDRPRVQPGGAYQGADIVEERTGRGDVTSRARCPWAERAPGTADSFGRADPRADQPATGCGHLRPGKHAARSGSRVQPRYCGCPCRRALEDWYQGARRRSGHEPGWSQSVAAPRGESAERRPWIRREVGRPCPSSRGEPMQTTGHDYKSAKYVPGSANITSRNACRAAGGS